MTDPVTWTRVVEYKDIRYEHSGTGIAKVTIDRPEVRNAFRPQTVTRADRRVRPDPRRPVHRLRAPHRRRRHGVLLRRRPEVQGHGGGYLDSDGVARLNVLDLQRQIRSLPIPVIALVNGYAIGGGHVLHVVCDLSIAAENAIFGQVGPRVGSFDAGFGVGLLARLVGDKKAKEIWFLCRQYTAAEALDDGPREQGRAARGPRGRGRPVGGRDPGDEPDGDPLPEVGVPRRDATGWPGSRSSPATRRACTTRPTRRTRAAPRSSRSARPTSRKYPRRP